MCIRQLARVEYNTSNRRLHRCCPSNSGIRLSYIIQTSYQSPTHHMQCPFTCCTSSPRAQTSVLINTRDVPDLNSTMIASRSFCGMSPCIAETVKLLERIFSVSQSTLRLVLQKMTAYRHWRDHDAIQKVCCSILLLTL